MANNFPIASGGAVTAEMVNKSVRAHILYGCRVDAGASTADLSLDLKAGQVYCDGEIIAFTATTQTINAADATNPRWDLIGIKIDTSANTATKVYYAGTPAATPAKPSTTSTDEPVIPLAYVYVGATVTGLANAKIYDARQLMGDRGVPMGTIVGIHTSMTGVPGIYPNFEEMDGTNVSHADSPMNGQAKTNLNGASEYFLYGKSTTGSTKAEDYLVTHDHPAVYHDYHSTGGTAAFVISNSTTGTTSTPIQDTGSGTAWNGFSVKWYMRVFE